MDEGPSPVKRYKWFRPREAARGWSNYQNPTNYGAISLYNDGSNRYLIVRDVRAADPNSNPLFVYYANAKVGTPVGAVTPFIPGEAKMPGIINYADLAALVSNPFDQLVTTYDLNWPHDFPYAILPPNWSLVCQDNAAAATFVSVEFVWEAIYPEELDYLFDL